MSTPKARVNEFADVGEALAGHDLSQLDSAELDCAQVWVLPDPSWKASFGDEAFIREADDALCLAREFQLDARLYTLDEHPKQLFRKAAVQEWQLPVLVFLLDTARQVPVEIAAAYLIRFLGWLKSKGMRDEDRLHCRLLFRKSKGVVEIDYDGPASEAPDIIDKLRKL